MRWYTCTPVAFGGGPDFFARDSGLLCRGFQLLGMESRAVMPGERKTEDEDDLIRTEYANLESSDWWRDLGLDGVVLYAWGSPKYRHIARAIHEAGIRLVLNQDNGGLVSPVLGAVDWSREQWILSGAGRVRGGFLRWCKLLAKGFTKGIFRDDPLRVTHLHQGDLIACVSPIAAEQYRKFCRIYGDEEWAGRVRVLSHAVQPRFRFAGEKHRQVVVVGRWDDVCQKRPELLMEVVGKLVDVDPGCGVEIVGTVTEELRSWHANLPDGHRTRVTLRGRMLPQDMVAVYSASQVSYCPSAFESFHIASGEALCCGCSVVAARSPSLASFPWFVGDGCGTLAAEDEADAHVAAILQELDLWENGQRNAALIAGLWQSRLHADKVAGQVIEEV